MSETTTSAARREAQSVNPELTAQLAAVPLYADASADHRALLEQDLAACVGEALPLADYLDGLRTWEGDAESYLRESGYLEGGPESGPEPAADGAAAAARQAQQAAEAAEQEDERQREAADVTLRLCVKAYRQGERAYARGLLDAGKLASAYIAQRLTLGDKRAAAVQTLEGQLAKYASSPVDVNRLVGCWEAHRLLAVEQGLTTAPAKGKPAPADAVPYGHYRDAWMRLVERHGKDTPQEGWVLLPSLEADCRALYAEALKGGLSKAAVEERVRTLLNHHGAAQKRAADEAKAKADAEAAARAAEAAKAKAEREAAEAKVREAEAAAKAGQDAATAGALNASLQATAEALRERQRQEQAAQAAADQAARDKAAVDKWARGAEEWDRKAREKAQREADKAGRKATKAPAPAGDPAPKPECHAGENILATLAKSAGKATAKDYAGLVADCVVRHPDPLAVTHDLVSALAVRADKAAEYGADDVLEAMLAGLDGHACLSGKAKRAVKAALLVLASKSPAPADVATALTPANGTPAPAVA
jgi:hypothetical protein